jgi:nucleoid DNA-binding protein
MPEYASMKDIAANVAKRQNITPLQAEAVVMDIFDCMRYYVAGGLDVKINHFGVFYLRIPREEEKYNHFAKKVIPTKKGVGFRPAKQFKDHVNGVGAAPPEPEE